MRSRIFVLTLVGSGLVVVAGLAAVGYQLSRPIPPVPARFAGQQLETLGTAAALPWPSSGEASLMIEGVGPVGASGPRTPVSMASTAKLMTALLVLEDHPLTLDATGPTITVTSDDVQSFRREQALNQSVVPVVAGERLSERELLDGLLIPSANNFADLLATWDAGSIPDFVRRMNARAAGMRLSNTHFADPSGFDAAGVSIPEDLVEIARQAMAIPLFANIVSHKDTVLPEVGRVQNYDRILGQAGIIGVKTGNSDAVGGNFVFAAEQHLPGRIARVYGAVMGQASLQAAFNATLTLLKAAMPHLHYAIVVHRRDPVGTYSAAWGTAAAAHPDDFFLALYFDGMRLEQRVQLRTLDGPTIAGAAVGSLTASIGEQHATLRVVLDQSLEGPSLGWRLFRPLETG